MVKGKNIFQCFCTPLRNFCNDDENIMRVGGISMQYFNAFAAFSRECNTFAWESLSGESKTFCKTMQKH